MPDQPRIAYDTNESYQDHDTGMFAIAKIEENEPGYWRLPTLYPTLEDAQAEVNRLNDELGLHPGDVLDICASSMAAHNAAKYGEETTSDPIGDFSFLEPNEDDLAWARVNLGHSADLGKVNVAALRRMIDRLREEQRNRPPRAPRIEVLHVRETDSGCTVRIWIDGVEATNLYSVDVDPLRGHTAEQRDENHRDAIAAPELSESFRDAVDQAYIDNNPE